MPSEKLLLIVKDDSPASQLVEVYASTLPVAVEVLNLSEQQVPEHIWALILEQYRLSDIFFEGNVWYQKYLYKERFSYTTLQKALKADAQLLRHPIALLNKEVVICSAATDIFQFNLALGA